MRRENLAIILSLVLGIPTVGSAQHVPPSSPEVLSQAVLKAFVSGTSFDTLFPFPEGRAYLQRALAGARPRVAGFSRVAAQDSERAVLALSGYTPSSTPGTETLASAAFSGLYKAARESSGQWRLTERIPIDSGTSVIKQAIDVVVAPGRGLTVTDSITFTTSVDHGFTLRLHPRAELISLVVEGAYADHALGGGLLWVNAGASTQPRRLILQYRLPIAPDTVDGEAGRFFADYGHVRHYYYWHPFFDLSSARDDAAFVVRARLPAAYRLTTSLPQTELVERGDRVVTGTSARRTGGIPLAYSNQWSVLSFSGADYKLDAFIEPTWSVSPDSFVVAIRRVHELLSARYGSPGGFATSYYAIAHVRSLPRTQAFRTNDLIAMGEAGMAHAPERFPVSSAVLGHEVAHAWTHPTGAAEAWLMEGWAAYAESDIIRAELGAHEEERYWEKLRTLHYRTGAEGRWSIVGDSAVRVVSYRKGPWVFRALRHALGDSAFMKGMRTYIAIPPGKPAGLEEFVRAFSSAGQDVSSLLMPWLFENSLPDIEPHIEARRVILRHAGPPLRLPHLEIELHTEDGRKAVREIAMPDRTDTLDTGALGRVVAVRVDPHHRYLLRRRWGDKVSFVLPDSMARGAAKVELWGDIARPTQRITAVHTSTGWVAELWLPEGFYEWGWFVDGKVVRHPAGSQPAPGPLVVAPRHELQGQRRP